MSNQSVIEKSGHSTGRRKIAVMPAWPVNRQSGKRQQATAKKKAAIEMPLFHTAPIFKPKKHDFL